MGLSWVPSVGWEFDRDNWDRWRGVSITADDDANVNVTFTHEVWDNTPECPVHDAGPITVRAGSGLTTTPANDERDRDDGDSSQPALAIDDVTVAENAGTAVFTVSLSPQSDRTVTVAYTTADGTATAGSDYQTATGTLSFSPGDTAKTLAVPILDNGETEPTEEFSVTLSDAEGALLADSEGTGTITDDDTGGGAVAPSGLPQLTIADATVYENEGPAVFRIRLDRNSTEAISVNFATVDGSATAGSDYTAKSGMLTFEPGEREKAIAITVRDDDRKESDETFTVRLSNPRYASIADAEAAGTIRDDELAARVPEDWMRQFGSTATAEVVDAIAERMRCVRDRQPGAAGLQDGSQWQCAQQPVSTSFAVDSRMLARLTAAADGATVPGTTPVPHGRALPVRADLSAAAPGGSSLLSASSQRQSELGMSVWGRGSYARFDGGGELPLGGDTWTATLGVDIAFRQAVAGIAVAHSESEGSAAQQGGETDVTAKLTGFYPYLRIGVNDRISLWGTVGVGTGTQTHSTDGAASSKHGIAVTMAGAGGLAEVVAPSESGGVSVAVKADGLLLEVESEESAEMPSVSVAANRVRLALESGYEFVLHDRQRVAPFLEVGGRLDGADAESGTGLGLEVGGGVRYAHPVHHLTAEVYSHALLMHAADGLRNWSASGTLRYDPRSGQAHGPYLTITSSHGLGESAGPGSAAISGLTGAATDANREPRWGLATELGYGVPTPNGTATATPWAGLSLFRGRPEYRIGYRLQYDNGLHLSVAATMRDGYPLQEPPSYLLNLLLSLR